MLLSFAAHRVDTSGMELARLKVGEIVRVLPEGAVGGGQPLTVELVENRRFWLSAVDFKLKVGNRVSIERSISGDARYRGRFEAVSIVNTSIAFESLDEWQRHQARNFARVATGRLPLEGIDQEGGQSFEMQMLDLSTGGMQIETAFDLELGDQLDCRFTLPDSENLLTIPAAVFRLIATPRRLRERKGELYGLKFIQLSRSVETEITHWVFQQQIRKNNAERDRDNE